MGVTKDEAILANFFLRSFCGERPIPPVACGRVRFMDVRKIMAIGVSICLRQLASYFPIMKHARAVRHSLDKALSDDQQMFRKWSRVCGLALGGC